MSVRNWHIRADRDGSPTPTVEPVPAALVTTNRWILIVALLLVFPGTLASVALGAIGLTMLLLLALDGLVTAVIRPKRHWRTFPAATQLLLAAVIAGAVGGAIALAAWIV